MRTIENEIDDNQRTLIRTQMRQIELRRELTELAREIGRCANIADLNIDVSAMADSDGQRLESIWRKKLDEYEHNEFEKMNARCALVELELKQMKR